MKRYNLIIIVFAHTSTADIPAARRCFYETLKRDINIIYTFNLLYMPIAYMLIFVSVQIDKLGIVPSIENQFQNRAHDMIE